MVDNKGMEDNVVSFIGIIPRDCCNYGPDTYYTEQLKQSGKGETTPRDSLGLLQAMGGLT